MDKFFVVLGELEGVLVGWLSMAEWWQREVQGMLERLKHMEEGLEKTKSGLGAPTSVTCAISPLYL
jgi:hypothetical protein